MKTICSTIMSDKMDHHNFLKSFRNVYGVSVILTMLFQMYVQYFPVADHLICAVPGICGVPGVYAMQFEELPNALGRIFRGRHARGN
jgi:hypothetical protein